MDLEFQDIALRLGAAAAAGVALGINRDLQGKAMGARTLGLVGLGTATVAVATIQVPGMSENPDAMSRVVQGVIQGLMTGISFIGAGVILRDARTRSVEGLTTAATVWVTAALGIACGLAAWRSVGVALALALVLLVAVAWIENAAGLEKNDCDGNANGNGGAKPGAARRVEGDGRNDRRDDGTLPPGPAGPPAG
jgi:putative Mg2+ transporter-C (MgtC) family protein